MKLLITDEQARKWRKDRLVDREQIILRAKTPDALARIEVAAEREFDDRLRLLIQERINALKTKRAL